MNYTVIGAARSGLAAALLAKQLGHTVFVTDSKNIDEMKDAADKLEKEQINFEFGGHTARALDKADMVIASPGVPPTAQILLDAENKGIPVISELEFAWRQANNSVIAITGTNGKTTTTALTAHILNNSGRKAVAAGNIGTPLSAIVNEIAPETILVVEVSSFQLDRIGEFAPDVAVILNVTPDHIGYHGSMENYFLAKLKISSRQSPKNFLILNADDEQLSRGDINVKAQIMQFSVSPVARGIFSGGGRIKIKFSEQHLEEELMRIDELSLPGVHNLYNSMAAAIASRVFEIRNEDIRDSLMSFSGVEHRLEKVRTVEGVDYINDSKATNINAAWYALRSYDRPIVWIAGGRGDNNDYSQLDESVRDNVKTIIALGEERDAIFNHFSGMKRCHRVDSLEEAVQSAYEAAEPGDIVLFAPACKSFDMFVNYEQRGQVFKELVNKL